MHCIAEAVWEKCAVVLGSGHAHWEGICALYCRGCAGKMCSCVRGGHFMSILSDGNQARKTGKEKELVLVRTERNGIHLYLVASLLEVARFGGGNSNSIVTEINSIFQATESPLMDIDSYTNKVVSCTADGASVNFGVNPVETKQTLAVNNPLCKP